jgi:hypothetical protein
MNAIAVRPLVAAVALALAMGISAASFAQQAEPPAGHPLSKIKAGMPDAQVRDILGSPTSTNSYPTGKSWIPGYGWWGTDGHRWEWFYKGKGRVVFNTRWFSSRLKVIRVIYDPSEDGY